MKRSSLITIIIVMMFFYAGLISQTAAQGIRNDGATINISAGSYVVCPGGLNNNSGTVTNNGTLSLSGGITNAASNTIGGDGDYNVGGNWTNNGTFTAGTSTVTFSGTEPQNIAGSSINTFNNLVIDNNSAGTTISAGSRVTVSGNVFNPNGKLIINSEDVTNSGSLIYSGSFEPSGNVTYNRYLRPDNVNGDRHFISSPVGAQNVGTFITSNPGKIDVGVSGSEIREWDEEALAANWQIVSPAGSFESGRGYRVSQADGSNGLLTFTGSVVNTVTVTATSPYANYNGNPRSTAADYGDPAFSPNPAMWASGRSWDNYGGGGWNLMGNPFTSAMNAATFVSVNTGKFDPNYQALYVYDGNSTTPQYLYAAAAVPVPVYDNGGWFSDNIQAGQGFFVLALYNDIDFNFTPAMQVHNTDLTLLKSAEAESNPWPGLQLKVRYGDKERSTVIVYNSEMTIGCDPGYDVGQLSAGPDVEIYTSLVEKDNSVNFTRQALPLTDSEKNIIPVGIDTEKGGEVTFSAVTVPLEDKKFWLEDRVTGKFTNLNTNEYTVTLPAKNYGTGRFFIIASANTPTGISDLTGAYGLDLRIWTSDNKVIIKGAVNAGALCEIYDTGGRKVLMVRLTDGELNTVALPSDSHGVFLVRVIDAAKVITAKVALP